MPHTLRWRGTLRVWKLKRMPRKSIRLKTSGPKKGAALDMSYAVSLRPGASPLDLIAELNRIEGVSGVEMSLVD